MKEAELRKHATCDVCSKPIGACGLPLFWRVTVERFAVNLRAAERQDALATMLGSSALAAVMGPDEDLATPVMEPAVRTVCEACATEREVSIAALGLEQ